MKSFLIGDRKDLTKFLQTNTISHVGIFCVTVRGENVNDQHKPERQTVMGMVLQMWAHSRVAILPSIRNTGTNKLREVPQADEFEKKDGEKIKCCIDTNVIFAEER